MAETKTEAEARAALTLNCAIDEVILGLDRIGVEENNETYGLPMGLMEDMRAQVREALVPALEAARLVPFAEADRDAGAAAVRALERVALEALALLSAPRSRITVTAPGGWCASCGRPNCVDPSTCPARARARRVRLNAALEALADLEPLLAGEPGAPEKLDRVRRTLEHERHGTIATKGDEPR